MRLRRHQGLALSIHPGDVGTAAPSRVSERVPELGGSPSLHLSLPLPALFPNQGPSALPALPGVVTSAGPSATLPTPAGPRGFSVGAFALPTGLPVLLRPASSLRASAIAPAETVRSLCRSLPDPPSAFPVVVARQLPRCAFRGLLSAHSLLARRIAEPP